MYHVSCVGRIACKALFSWLQEVVKNDFDPAKAGMAIVTLTACPQESSSGAADAVIEIGTYLAASMFTQGMEDFIRFKKFPELRALLENSVATFAAADSPDQLVEKTIEVELLKVIQKVPPNPRSQQCLQTMQHIAEICEVAKRFVAEKQSAALEQMIKAVDTHVPPKRRQWGWYPGT